MYRWLDIPAPSPNIAPIMVTKRPDWTPEEAREMAKRSARARARKKEQERARLSGEASPEPEENLDPGNPKEPTRQKSLYVRESLSKTRKQIEFLCKLFDNSKNPKDLETLARSIATLRNVEQNLAGRPSPGSYRPEPPKNESDKPLISYSVGETPVRRKKLAALDD